MDEPPHIVKLAHQINEALVTYPAKEWNYSRITLVTKALCDLQSPYFLWIDLINLQDSQCKQQLKNLNAEVTWGGRHSDELGVLELISLRLNKALLEHTSDQQWDSQRPVIRLITSQELTDKGITTALWYAVTELSGEDFDSR